MAEQPADDATAPAGGAAPAPSRRAPGLSFSPTTGTGEPNLVRAGMAMLAVGLVGVAASFLVAVQRRRVPSRVGDSRA